MKLATQVSSSINIQQCWSCEVKSWMRFCQRYPLYHLYKHRHTSHYCTNVDTSTSFNLQLQLNFIRSKIKSKAKVKEIKKNQEECEQK